MDETNWVFLGKQGWHLRVNITGLSMRRGVPWWLIIKATGAPGHGAKLYDNTAMENILKSIESVRRFRAAQFDLVKAGLKAEGEVISVNMAFLKAGTPSPTVSLLNFFFFFFLILVAGFGIG